LGHLPIGAIIIKLGPRQIKLSKQTARELEELSAEQRRVLLAEAAAAKTDDEAAAIIKRGVETNDESKRPATAGVAATAKGPGVWRATAESMSPRARAYQTQITGRQEIYVVNGVKFDGFSNDILLEAKGPGYVKFVKGDRFRDWFTKLPNILAQAQSQKKPPAEYQSHGTWLIKNWSSRFAKPLMSRESESLSFTLPLFTSDS
jgi:hypothetical protein